MIQEELRNKLNCVISNNDKEISIYCFLKDICPHRRTGGNFLGGRAKIARKILLHKIMHMISSTVNILQLVFTYFTIYVRNKKMIQIINEYIKWLHGMEYIKSISNGLTETI